MAENSWPSVTAQTRYNVGINVGQAAGQTVFHLHIHLIPRYSGDVADPRGGVRHVIPSKGNYLLANDPKSDSPHDALRRRALVSGGDDDPLLLHLLANIDDSESLDMAVAFVLASGFRRLKPRLHDLLDRGGRVRLLTGDYIGVTDPNALLRLLDLEGRFELRVFETRERSFHPKAYIFHRQDGANVAYVGSSNLTESALTAGVEWNYRVVSSERGGGFSDVAASFEELFTHPSTRSVDPAWIAEYDFMADYFREAGLRGSPFTPARGALRAPAGFDAVKRLVNELGRLERVTLAQNKSSISLKLRLPGAQVSLFYLDAELPTQRLVWSERVHHNSRKWVPCQ